MYRETERIDNEEERGEINIEHLKERLIDVL